MFRFGMWNWAVFKKLMKEIKRILKNGGLFIGSVNGMQDMIK